MPAFNIEPLAPTDGILYANSVPLTSTEATLGDGRAVPNGLIPVEFGQCIVATVKLSINGLVIGNNSYVVMQLDMGDGNWIDMNWLVWTGSQGIATFVFSNGIAGANTLQQTRLSGAFPSPQALGSNQLALGGRIRFVGKSIFVGGSSSLAGVTTSVSATITYRLLGLR